MTLKRTVFILAFALWFHNVTGPPKSEKVWIHIADFKVSDECWTWVKAHKVDSYPAFWYLCLPRELGSPINLFNTNPWETDE